MDFLETCTSGRYHRDMKILKILASNSKPFQDYFLTNEKLMMIEEGTAKYYIFLYSFCLKQPLVLKIPLGMFF